MVEHLPFVAGGGLRQVLRRVVRVRERIEPDFVEPFKIQVDRLGENNGWRERERKREGFKPR